MDSVKTMMRSRFPYFFEYIILMVVLLSIVTSWTVTFMFVGNPERDETPEKYLTRPSVYENRVSSDPK
jgi:hypothetical protein